MGTWRRLQQILIVVWIVVVGINTQLLSQSHSLTVQTQIEPQTVRENKAFTFIVTVSWFGSPQDYRLVEFPQLKLRNILLIESGAATRSEQQSDSQIQIQRIFTFHLKPISAGQGAITGGTIKLQNTNGEMVILPIPEVTVQIAPGYSGRPQFLAYIYLFLMGILLIAVVYSFVLYLRKKRTFISHEMSLEMLQTHFQTRLAGEVDPKGGNLRHSLKQLEKIFLEYQQTLKTVQWNPEEETERQNLNTHIDHIHHLFQTVNNAKQTVSDKQFIEIYQAMYQLFALATQPVKEEHLVN